MTKQFARLEEHDGMQVLARKEQLSNDAGDYGPCVVVRCDPSHTVEMTYGPWTDDKDGDAAADDFFDNYDLAAFAAEAKTLMADMFSTEDEE